MTIDEIIEHMYKCVEDKTRIYMIETFFSTYDLTYKRYVQFALFPKQKELLTAFSKYSNNITTKPRQAGISTTTAAFIACEIALSSAKSPIVICIVANKLDMSKDFLKKIKEFLQQVPRFFWGDDFYGDNEKENKSIFKIDNQVKLELVNGCEVYARSAGPNATRGISSVSWLIFDEAAFIENGPDVYASAVATTATGGHIIMISTPNGKDALYYNTYNLAKKEENGFHLTELRWYQDPRYNKGLKWVKDGEFINEIEFTYESYENKVRNGYKPTSPWYVSMCAKLNNDSQRIAQELDVSFIGSSDTVISPETIQFHEDTYVKDPSYQDPMFKEMWIWKEPQEGHKYIMGVDASRGDAADSSVIEIVDTNTMEQVAEYVGKMPGDMLGDLVYKYGSMYGNAFCVVDCVGGTGDACVLKLQELKYKNLYYDDPKIKTPTIQEARARLKINDEEKLPGFHSSSIRTQMIMNLETTLRIDGVHINSSRMRKEMETFVFKNGRPDHMDGYHDDTLQAMAMLLYVLQFSFKQLEINQNKDKVILQAFVAGRANNITNSTLDNKPTNPLPFYTPKSFKPNVNRWII